MIGLKTRIILLSIVCILHAPIEALNNYSIDVVGGPEDFVHVETQWPVAALSDKSAIKGYLGVYTLKDEVDYVPLLCGVIGYNNSELGIDILWVELDAGFGMGFGGYSDRLSDGFFMKGGVAIMMDWLLPIQYGVSYRFQSSIMTAKNNDPLSLNASAMALVFRLPISKDLFFPEVVPIPKKNIEFR